MAKIRAVVFEKNVKPLNSDALQLYKKWCHQTEG